ncbi:MAG TPA: ATP-binding cassette domain-containing protein [Acidobacteriota bacterium]|jgi:ABC-2 type transport system ATP-binding protein|nr:ATP-binding cassette domain-containing protein [Acidobacteriota bacterium]
MDAVIVNNLTKRYGSLLALDNVSFSVGDGEIFGLLGPNGAGKTTTVKVLATLLNPTSGSVSVAGHDAQREPSAVRQSIGYVSQEQMCDVYLTGRENLWLQGNLNHLERRVIEQRIEELSRLLELEDALDKIVKQYSGGMKKKLDIASGLIHRPQILLLDEPSLGLDVPTRLKVWEYIQKLHQEGTAILLCTNYMDEAEKLASRVAIIDRGKVAAVDTVQNLLADVGGEVVTLETEDGASARRAAFEDQLKKLPFVKRVMTHDKSLEIFLHYDEAVLPQIMQTAMKSSVPIRKLVFSTPGLDAVFLKYTGHRMKAAGDMTE